MSNRRPPLKVAAPGANYCDDLLGHKVCAGAKMGMPDDIPVDLTVPVKMRMVRMRWVDGDYIPNGAYFGCPMIPDPKNRWGKQIPKDYIYYALSDGPEVEVVNGRCPLVPCAYVRASDRKEAKAKILELIPLATFYR